ncbi:SDR family oxidoreductase [Sphingomonas sp.]|uniref:SDR family oxidoreductase n=1 Tax=Sphingomonas sp. TaxID=28214 RepID=UPI0028B052A1|nr:SDR family oxidoreductase [Sphingomonas sp.]
MHRWTATDIPSQHGRSAVITGTGGLALEDARALAAAGSAVILAGRNSAKGAQAVAEVRAAVPGATIRFEALDLANLSSVARFAERLNDQQEGLELLINNAAVMAPPSRLETSDGLELQFGTNYLGHFALTARLLPLLKRGRKPRVVTLSSVAARGSVIDFDDLQAARRYRPMPIYGQSKLACLLFALELSRQSRWHGWGIASIAAHPGIARTDLIANGAGPRSTPGRLRRILPFLFQPAWQGALPTLFAATDPSAQDGCYYGPHALGGTRGYPALEKPPAPARDGGSAVRLWEESCRLADVRFA